MSMCLNCNDRPAYHAYYGEEFGLCGVCAERVANLFNFAHSGRWLTYPNEMGARSLRIAMPAQIRWDILRAAKFTCQACGETARPMHIDHIIPLAKGGSNEIENLQCLCDRCNMAKGAR